MIVASCIICLEICSSNADLSALSCGHIFHFSCITEWFKKVKSCPTCRSKQKKDNYIKKIFFNPVANSSILDYTDYKENECILKSKISKLEKQNKELIEKYECNVKYHTEQIKQYDALNSLYKSVLKELEILRIELNKLQVENSDKENQIKCLNKNVEKLKFVEIIIKNESGDILKQIETIKQNKNMMEQLELLVTALLVLRKNCSQEKNQTTEETLKSLKNNYQKLKIENIKLQDVLKILQEENNFNKAKMVEYEQHMIQERSVNGFLSDVKEHLNENEIDHESKLIECSLEKNIDQDDYDMDEENFDPTLINPFLTKNVQSVKCVKNLFIMRKACSNLKNISDVTNKPVYMSKPRKMNVMTTSSYSVSEMKNFPLLKSNCKTKITKSKRPNDKFNQTTLKGFIKR